MKKKPTGFSYLTQRQFEVRLDVLRKKYARKFSEPKHGAGERPVQKEVKK